jgi:hypothetical protein
MRRLGWILWLFIALLPLRGMAHAAMTTAAAAQPPAVTMSAAADEAPCPMQADSGSAGCAMCDLCCAVVALAPAPPLRFEPQALGAPLVALAQVSAPAPLGRLFRPPR